MHGWDFTLIRRADSIVKVHKDRVRWCARWCLVPLRRRELSGTYP